jgi:DnaJ homolog subfamily B member 4
MPFNSKFYDILQVSNEADRETICAAYRKLALQYHPLRNDTSCQAEMQLKFNQIAEAFEVLNNPRSRVIYD